MILVLVQGDPDRMISVRGDRSLVMQPVQYRVNCLDVIGLAERWRISMADGSPFAVAGIWRAWQEEQGYTYRFSLLTINADTYPLLRRMHKLGDEKRSLLVVPRQDYDTWLGCWNPELARNYLIQQTDELLTGTPMPAPHWAESSTVI